MAISEEQHNVDGGNVHAGRFLDAPIGATKKKRSGVRWRTMLIVFMRLAACVWMLKGLLSWAFIIGLIGNNFPDLRLSRQGIVIGFAVLDLVAAVGLWLASSWGAAVWLLVLIVEATLPFLVPDLTRPVGDALIAATFGALYLFFVWKTMQDEDSA